MVKCATATNRVLRGTEIVAQAFFAAVEEIPDNRRNGVIKAALVLIREKLSGRFQGSTPGVRTSRRSRAVKTKRIGSRRG